MAQSLLCETVTGGSMRDLLAARSAATAGGLVELRLDGVKDLDVAGALKDRRTPAVVTCRASWEGGRFDGSEEERQAILRRALDEGAEYVDVEWRAGFDDLIRRAPSRIVVSFHDFTGVPADLEARARAMRGTGAGTIKVACTASRLTDTLPLKAIGQEGGAVVVGMGASGVPSRLLATKYGSRWSYAGDAVAPGQMPAGRMIREFRFDAVGAGTRLFGVVSRTALHSLSPAMHNRAFAAAGLDAVYVPLPTDDFADFLAYAEAMGLEGASITIPFKLDALRAAQRVDAVSRAVGAVNTLRRRDVWEATNTDVDGFLAPLDRLFPGALPGLRASVLGGGGAARAAVFALVSRGARVTVHARRADQAREAAQAGAGAVDSPAALPPAEAVAVGPWPPRPGSWDLLVNGTPLGGAARRRESPLPDVPLDGRAVYDLTYGEGESALLEAARRAGCLTLDGLPMLVAQAERQFEWWTGTRPAVGVMQEAAVDALGARGGPQARQAGTGVQEPVR